MIDPERKLFAAHGFASYRAQLLEQRLAWLLCTAFVDKPAGKAIRADAERVFSACNGTGP